MKKRNIFAVLYILFFFCSYAHAITVSPVYSYVNESTNISFMSYGTVNVSIVTPLNNTYNTVTNNDYVIFPDDFIGASTSSPGNYTVSIRAENDSIVANGTVYIRPEPVATFVVGSDFHFVNGSSNHVQNEWIADINNEKWFRLPNAIFVNGDIGEDKTGLVDAKHALDQLNVTYYPMCSNHDSLPENLTERGDEYYRVFGGPYNYNITINGINFICMSNYMSNTSLMAGFDRYITYPISRAWFAAVSNDSMPTFLIYHYPLLNTRTAGGAYNFGSMNDANADLVRGIMETNEVIAEIAGHNHIVSHVRQNNVSYICEGTVQSPLYYYQYYEVYNDHVNVHTIRQNDTPITSYIWTTSTDTLHPTVSLYHEGNESEREFTISIDPITIETLKPNIMITSFDPSNVSCNIEFVISNITDETITYIQNDVTAENVYKTYDPTTRVVYGNATATTDNVTIITSNLVNGTYRVAETGNEHILVTYWNLSNTSCFGIFQIWNSTPVTNVRLILHDVVMGERYSIFNYETNVIKGAATAYNNATIDILGLPDGIYYISVGSGSQTTSIVKSTYVIGSVVVTTLVTGSLLYRRRKHD